MVVEPHPGDHRIFSAPRSTLFSAILALQITNFDNNWSPGQLIYRSTAVEQTI